VAQAERAWYRNANQIAAFLHGLNPKNWPLAALRSMMHMHLNLTLTEAVDQLSGKYTRSVKDFDVVENEILTMADTLSNGIIMRRTVSTSWTPRAPSARMLRSSPGSRSATGTWVTSRPRPGSR
jgi:hypothetical protein